MNQYFLKASDEAALRAALIAAGILLETEDGEDLADGYCLDVIGRISKPTGQKVTVDGIETDEMQIIDGHHANLLGELSAEQVSALSDVLLPEAPAQPYRVWAS